MQKVCELPFTNCVCRHVRVVQECQRPTIDAFTRQCSYPTGIHTSRASTQAGFCRSCFNEVCSRCDGGRDGTNDSIEVRIDGLPVCVKPPLGAVAPSRGTTVDSLTLLKGYFRTSNESHDVRKCYHERACRGGSDADEYCTFGYTGPCEWSFVLRFFVVKFGWAGTTMTHDAALQTCTNKCNSICAYALSSYSAIGLRRARSPSPKSNGSNPRPSISSRFICTSFAWSTDSHVTTFDYNTYQSAA